MEVAMSFPAVAVVDHDGDGRLAVSSPVRDRRDVEGNENDREAPGLPGSSMSSNCEGIRPTGFGAVAVTEPIYDKKDTQYIFGLEKGVSKQEGCERCACE